MRIFKMFDLSCLADFETYIEELDKEKNVSYYDSIFYRSGSTYYGFGIVFDEEARDIFDKICFSYKSPSKNIITGFVGVLTLLGYNEKRILELCNMDINSCGGMITNGICTRGKAKDTDTLFAHTLQEKCGIDNHFVNNGDEGRELVKKCIEEVGKAFGIAKIKIIKNGYYIPFISKEFFDRINEKINTSGNLSGLFFKTTGLVGPEDDMKYGSGMLFTDKASVRFIEIISEAISKYKNALDTDIQSANTIAFYAGISELIGQSSYLDFSEILPSSVIGSNFTKFEFDKCDMKKFEDNEKFASYVRDKIKEEFDSDIKPNYGISDYVKVYDFMKALEKNKEEMEGKPFNYIDLIDLGYIYQVICKPKELDEETKITITEIIPGHLREIEDALKRNNLNLFF